MVKSVKRVTKRGHQFTAPARESGPTGDGTSAGSSRPTGAGRLRGIATAPRNSRTHDGTPERNAHRSASPHSTASARSGSGSSASSTASRHRGHLRWLLRQLTHGHTPEIIELLRSGGVQEHTPNPEGGLGLRSGGDTAPSASVTQLISESSPPAQLMPVAAAAQTSSQQQNGPHSAQHTQVPSSAGTASSGSGTSNGQTIDSVTSGITRGTSATPLAEASATPAAGSAPGGQPGNTTSTPTPPQAVPPHQQPAMEVAVAGTTAASGTLPQPNQAPINPSPTPAPTPAPVVAAAGAGASVYQIVGVHERPPRLTALTADAIATFIERYEAWQRAGRQESIRVACSDVWRLMCVKFPVVSDGATDEQIINALRTHAAGPGGPLESRAGHLHLTKGATRAATEARADKVFEEYLRIDEQYRIDCPAADKLENKMARPGHYLLNRVISAPMRKLIEYLLPGPSYDTQAVIRATYTLIRDEPISTELQHIVRPADIAEAFGPVSGTSSTRSSRDSTSNARTTSVTGPGKAAEPEERSPDDEDSSRHHNRNRNRQHPRRGGKRDDHHRRYDRHQRDSEPPSGGAAGGSGNSASSSSNSSLPTSGGKSTTSPAPASSSGNGSGKGGHKRSGTAGHSAAAPTRRNTAKHIAMTAPVVTPARDSGHQPPPQQTQAGLPPSQPSSAAPPAPNTATATNTAAPSDSQQPASAADAKAQRDRLLYLLRKKRQQLRPGHLKAIAHLPSEMRAAISGLVKAGHMPMHVPFTCFGVEGIGIADTGNSRAVVNPSFLDRLPADKRPPVRQAPVPLEFETANGIITASRMVQLPIKLRPTFDGRPVPLPVDTYGFYVADADTLPATLLFDINMVRNTKKGIGFIFNCCIQLGMDIDYVKSRDDKQSTTPAPDQPATAAAATLREDSLPPPRYPIRDLLPPELCEPDEDLDLHDDHPQHDLSKDELLASLNVSEQCGTAAQQATRDLCVQHAKIFGPVTRPCKLPPLTVEFIDPNVKPIDEGAPIPIHDPVRRQKVIDGINEDLQSGRFVHSNSQWGCHNVIVGKRDSTKVRRCANLTKINKLVKRDPVRFQPLAEIIDSIQGCTHFSVIDTTTGYQQLALAEGVGAIFAEWTILGKIEPDRAPFGFIGSGDAFYRGLRSAFAKLIASGNVYIYGDDILIATSGTWEDHVSVLRKVFRTVDEWDIRINPKKCRLMCNSVSYCGIVIDGKTRSIDPDRLSGLRDCPEPKTRSQLSSFLGLTSYYRDFVPKYIDIVAPLQECLTSSKGKRLKPFWTPACKRAHREIRTAILEAAPLMIPHFDREFILTTDASGSGIGCTLSQHDDNGVLRPVAFGSRAFKPPEGIYNTTERECLALHWALEKWAKYLAHTHFTWRTDHNNLRYLQKSSNSRVQRWILHAQQFDFDVEFVPGLSNVVCDTLSRVAHPDPKPLSQPAVVIAVARLLPRLHSYQQRKHTAAAAVQLAAPASSKPAPFSSNLLSSIAAAQAAVPAEQRKSWTSSAGYSTVTIDGYTLHLRHGNYVIPEGATNLQLQLLRLAHEEAGHGGSRRTFQRLVDARVTWPNIRSSVAKHVHSCPRCQIAKAPLQPSTTVGNMMGVEATGPFDRIQIDYAGPYPLSDGGNAFLLTAICCFTRWSILRAVRSDDAATTVRFLRELIRDHGRPRIMQSDNGSHFKNAVVEAFCAANGIKQHYTSVEHAQSNGKVERQHRVVVECLRAILSQHPQRWDEIICEIQEYINSAYNRSIGTSPFRALYGYDPRTAIIALTGGNPQITSDIEQLHRMIDVVQAYVRHVQANAFDANRADYDSVRSPVSYAIGSKVLVHRNNRANKLLSHWHGPYTVTERVNDNIYNVSDRKGVIHRVHVARIRSLDTSRLTSDDEEEMWCPTNKFLVESIIGHRLNADGTYHFRVKWLGYDDDKDITWAEMRDISHTPAFKLYAEEHSDINFAAAPQSSKRVPRKSAARDAPASSSKTAAHQKRPRGRPKKLQPAASAPAPAPVA